MRRRTTPKFAVIMVLLALCAPAWAAPFLACHEMSFAAGAMRDSSTLKDHDAIAGAHNHGHHHAEKHAPQSAVENDAGGQATGIDCDFLCKSYCRLMNAVSVPAEDFTIPVVHAWTGTGIAPSPLAQVPDTHFRPPARA